MIVQVNLGDLKECFWYFTSLNIVIYLTIVKRPRSSIVKKEIKKLRLSIRVLDYEWYTSFTNYAY